MIILHLYCLIYPFVHFSAEPHILRGTNYASIGLFCSNVCSPLIKISQVVKLFNPHSSSTFISSCVGYFKYENFNRLSNKSLWKLASEMEWPESRNISSKLARSWTKLVDPFRRSSTTAWCRPCSVPWGDRSCTDTSRKTCTVIKTNNSEPLMMMKHFIDFFVC